MNSMTSQAQANEGVKKSRLCRLLCGRARPFRTAGSRLNSLGAAASAGGQRFFHTFNSLGQEVRPIFGSPALKGRDNSPPATNGERPKGAIRPFRA